jgi:hypothetical protein
MHKRPFKKDEKATAEKHYHSRYSYVSRRIHPDSDPPHGCEYLCGLVDVGERRQLVFERDGYKCVDCGKQISWSGGHLAHKGHTKISRCDCPENLSCKCPPCHQENDHSGRCF